MQQIQQLLQQIATELLKLFTVPMFEIGGARYSLSFITTLIFIVIAVFWFAQFLSNWLKKRVLIRMIMDRGTREVIAAFIRYLLTFLALIIVLQTAGVNLSSLTIFAGVIGIGFGFGLQNLASNFISGLTLLLEQPIRVGDFIQVDDLLGTVENISVRSTIVRTQDGVFVIVPNTNSV